MSFDFVRDFGGVGDGVTDNSRAWNAFNAAAILANPKAGVELVLPSGGFYVHDLSKCFTFLRSIPKLRIIGHGATIQNIWPGGKSNLWFSMSMPLPIFAGFKTIKSYLIAATNVGDISVTTLNSADAANFAVDEPALVLSGDIQGYGYPMNTDNVDFVRIKQNPATGQLFIDRPLKNAHRTDFPDFSSPFPCGKARIWKLNTDAFSVSWDVEHTYEGFSILPAPNSGDQYQTVTGRHIRYVDIPCMLGPSPSGCETSEFTRVGFLTGGEPDKLCDDVIFDDCRGPGLGWQSSSINRVRMRGGSWQAYNVGSAKATELDGVEIGQLTFGNTYGAARTVNVRGGFVRSVYNPSSDVISGSNMVIDGTNITYAGTGTVGTFTILKTSNLVPHWCLLSGQLINLSAAGNWFSGDPGTGIVIGTREDATNVYIDTTLPFITLPPWAGTLLRARRCGEIAFHNVDGCDTARQISYATSQGLKSWDIMRATIASPGTTGGAFAGLWAGCITSLSLNVRQAGTGKFMFNSYMVPVPAFTPQQLLTATIDTTIPGCRVITPSGWAGKQGSLDTLTYGGTIPGLPTLQSIRSLSWGLSGSGAIIDIIARFDVGMYGQSLLAQFGAGTSELIHLPGSLP